MNKVLVWTAALLAAGCGVTGPGGTPGPTPTATKSARLEVTVAAGGDVILSVAPDDPGFAAYPDARALTYLDLIDNTIVGGRTVFQTRADITGESPAPLFNVVLHEVGHVLGLGASPS